MAENVRIKGVISRDINKKMWERDIANMKQLDDENLGRLMAISTILEGNGRPLGITEKQDVAARRLSPSVLQKINRPTDQNGRIPVSDLDPHLAKAAIIQEKQGRLSDNGLDVTDKAVATLFNGEKNLKERTGKDYVEWLSQTLIDIATNPKNTEARQMMGSLLDVNSRDRR